MASCQIVRSESFKYPARGYLSKLEESSSENVARSNSFSGARPRSAPKKTHRNEWEPCLNGRTQKVTAESQNLKCDQALKIETKRGVNFSTSKPCSNQKSPRPIELKSILKKTLERSASYELTPSQQSQRKKNNVQQPKPRNVSLPVGVKEWLSTTNPSLDACKLANAKITCSDESLRKTDVQKIQDELLECTICLDGFETPKMLPCMHTFCLKCLDNMTKRSHSVTCFECPVCRRNVVIPDGGLQKLPTNFYVQKLLEIVPATSDVTEHQNYVSPATSPSSPTSDSSPPVTPGTLPSTVVRRKHFCIFHVDVPVRDLMFDKNGNLIITCGHAIQIRDFMSGRILKEISHPKLSKPCGLSVMDDKIIVSDSGSHDVKIFSYNGKLLGIIKENLSDPRGLAVSNQGEILVADGKRIVIFDLKGKYLRIFAGNSLVKPTYIAVTDSNDVVVSDCHNNETKFYDYFGNMKHVFCSRNSSKHPASSLNALATDKQGLVFVTDHAKNKIHVCDSKHTDFSCSYLTTRNEGLNSPVAIAANNSGYLAIAEEVGNVKIYKYLK